MNLTPALLSLMEHEKAIEQFVSSALDVGWCLSRIREQQLYKAAGYKSFNRYCTDRWDMSRTHADRLVAAGIARRELEQVTPIGVTLPASESLLRPLTKLPDAESKAAAWARALEIAAAEGNPSMPTATQVARAVREFSSIETTATHKQRKKHPATFPAAILDVVAAYLEPGWRVLDPFAGIGTIHQLRDRCNVDTVGVEIEPEWAELGGSICGDVCALPFPDGAFDVVVTSPTYGNRMADHHNAADPSHRNTYRHTLGRELSEGSSAGMQWGVDYMAFHHRAWDEAVRVLKRGGLFILNVKDHIRDDAHQHVAAWHLDELMHEHGSRLAALHSVPTRGLPSGENAETRVPVEYVFVLEV